MAVSHLTSPWEAGIIAHEEAGKNLCLSGAIFEAERGGENAAIWQSIPAKPGKPSFSFRASQWQTGIKGLYL